MRWTLPLLILCACGGEPQPGPKSEPLSREQAEKLAYEASGELMKTLLTELTNTVREKKADEAFEVCAGIAQSITDRIRAEKGVEMRRTALRYRNPKNAPDAFERAWMEKVVASGEVPTTPYGEIVDGELRYLRPLGVAPICTKCHGPKDTLDPGVVAALAERYPHDRATGFQPGDFRGAVSVRIPLRR
jgi:hypothetical protein